MRNQAGKYIGLGSVIAIGVSLTFLPEGEYIDLHQCFRSQIDVYVGQRIIK